MEAFFLSIAALFALLVLATALCVALRFGITSRVAPSSGVGDEFVQPRQHVAAGALVVSLAALFSVALMFAIMAR